MKKIQTFEEHYSTSRPMEIDAEKELDSELGDDLMSQIKADIEVALDTIESGDFPTGTDMLRKVKDKLKAENKHGDNDIPEYNEYRKALGIWHGHLNKFRDESPEDFKVWDKKNRIAN